MEISTLLWLFIIPIQGFVGFVWFSSPPRFFKLPKKLYNPKPDHCHCSSSDPCIFYFMTGIGKPRSSIYTSVQSAASEVQAPFYQQGWIHWRSSRNACSRCSHVVLHQCQPIYQNDGCRHGRRLCTIESGFSWQSPNSSWGMECHTWWGRPPRCWFVPRSSPSGVRCTLGPGAWWASWTSGRHTNGIHTSGHLTWLGSFVPCRILLIHHRLHWCDWRNPRHAQRSSHWGLPLEVTWPHASDLYPSVRMHSLACVSHIS